MSAEHRLSDGGVGGWVWFNSISSLADAFAIFDHDSDGVLTPAELYGGMDWLGLHLNPKEVRTLFTVRAARAFVPFLHNIHA